MQNEEGRIGDVKILTDKYMVESKEVKRTCLERLFSLHWCTCYKTVYVPLKQIIRTNDGLIMHPDVWEIIQKENNEEKEGNEENEKNEEND